MNLVIEFIHEYILAIDFAMFILIWLVQLIIYPAFIYISDSSFKLWHGVYCKRISYFVLPLMISQLFESAAACFFIGGNFEFIKLVLILCTWAFTFLFSARYHKLLSEVGKDSATVKKLIFTNWFRTISWSFILIISYFQYQ